MKVFPLAQNPGAVVHSDGMDLRDYFAAQCDLAPYAEHIGNYAALNGPLTVTEAANYIAAIRYAEADAMLAARAPTPEIPDA